MVLTNGGLGDLVGESQGVVKIVKFEYFFQAGFASFR